MFSLIMRSKGSLTKILRQKKGDIVVTVLKEGHVYATLKQAKEFSIRPRKRIFQRRVILSHDNTPLIRAEMTILQALPVSHRLYHLGDRPLGDFLFKQHALHREFIAINILTRKRRSCFHLGHLQLYLKEKFLPGILSCQNT